MNKMIKRPAIQTTIRLTRHQILDHVHVRQRVNFNLCLGLAINTAQTGQSIGTVDIHGTRATNPFTARTTKSQGWVGFIFDFNYGVKDHGATCVDVNFVGLKGGFDFGSFGILERYGYAYMEVGLKR